MYNYCFSKITNKNNDNEQGYELRRGDEHLETLLYDIDKISHKELVQKKKNFLILFAVNILILIEEVY